MNKKIFAFLAVIALVSLACEFSLFSEEATPTPDLGPQQTGTALAIAQAELENQKATMDAQFAAESAQQTADAIAAQEAQETAAAIAQAQTQEAAEAEVPPTEEISEPAPEEDPFSALEATMREEMQQLYDDGILASTDGEFIPFQDFEESIAKINYVTWWATDFAPTSYAIRANAEWSSASDSANWFNSGCGFVYGLEDNRNFHLAYLALDGNVNLKRWVNGDQTFYAQDYYGSVDIPDGSAEITMVVQGQRTIFLVNGEEVSNQHDSLLKPGTLAFTVLSGTNAGFGTRCKLTDIGLMIFE
jgi:hypothetical protein